MNIPLVHEWYGLLWLMVFNATFNNISVISWRLVLLVAETVESVLVCPAKSVSPHKLVQITEQLADCRSVHGFKSFFAFVPVPLDVLVVHAGTSVDKI